MAEVFLGLGSNISPRQNFSAGVAELRQMFGSLRLSACYESAALGFEGDNFLNMVVAAHTDLSVEALCHNLRELEYRYGRPRNASKFSSRHLDIDLLLYGEAVGQFGSTCLPREEILENAFVLRPLAELAPQLKHPVSFQKFKDIWAGFSSSSASLTPVYDWDLSNDQDNLVSHVA